MSNYITQLVPEQIMNMVSKLKEATLDVGPQPVKFAKFSSIPLNHLFKLLTEAQINNIAIGDLSRD